MKWPSDKRKYDRNYLRWAGKICPKCKDKGENKPAKDGGCPECDGLGYVEKK